MEKDVFEALLKKSENQRWIGIVKEYEEVWNWLSLSPVSEQIIVSRAKHLDMFLDDVALNPRDFLNLSGIRARDLTEKKCEEYISNRQYSKVNEVKNAVQSFYNFSHKEDGERIYFKRSHQTPGCPA